MYDNFLLSTYITAGSYLKELSYHGKYDFLFVINNAK